jgi:hypothetical protein
MSTRREIDDGLRRLSKLASQLTDQRTLAGIKHPVADLVAAKAAFRSLAFI